MKLARYGEPGEEKPALADKAGRLRGLNQLYADVDAQLLAPDHLEALARIDPESLPPLPGDPRLRIPCSGMTKFVCIGLNYSDHAPIEPVWLKPGDLVELGITGLRTQRRRVVTWKTPEPHRIARKAS